MVESTRLDLEGVTVVQRGRTLLDHVSLGLEAREFLALVGPNGAGKTTLFRAALGLVAAQGRALLDGRPVAAFPGRERAARVAWLPQQALVGEPIHALELVAAARFRFDEPRPVSLDAARAALARSGAEAFCDRPISELSGGEQQRVAIAALLAQDAPLLLLDEPANHLDPAQQIEIYRLLGKLWREGKGILCITHDVNLLRHVGASTRPIRLGGMRSGRLAFETSYGASEVADAIGELFGIAMRTVDGLLIPEARR